MQKAIPATPADALAIPAGLRLALRAVCTGADIFGFWRSPAAGAATDFPEMTLLDKMYWAYKSRQPVTRGEKGAYDEGYFSASRQAGIRLPAGFEKKAAVTFGAAGDLIPAPGIERSKDFLFAEVAELLFDRDISYANLEAPLTDQTIREEVLSDKESPIECCSLAQFEAMRGHRGKNFTLLHTAGNHTMDMGVEGVETTLRQLERERIIDLGTNREPAGYGEGKILTRNGIRIGFASATFSLNGRQTPGGKEYVVHAASLLPKKGEPDLSLLKRQIDFCRAQGCDLIVASLHWGYEFEFFPRQKQVDIAHTLIEWGADILIGHHPHVVQPVEYYRTRRDRDRVAVIAYSLGTLTWSFTAPHLVLSALLDLSVAKGTFRGEEKTYIESAQVVPVYRSWCGEGNSLQIRIEKLGDSPPASEEKARYLAEIRKYAELVFGRTEAGQPG